METLKLSIIVKKWTSFYIKIDKFTVHFKSFFTHNGYAWNVQISLFSSVRIGKKTGSKKKKPKNKKYKIFFNIIFITFNTILLVRFLHNMIKEHNLDPISLLKNFNWRKKRTDQVYKVWLAKNLFRKFQFSLVAKKTRLCLKYYLVSFLNFKALALAYICMYFKILQLHESVTISFF